MSQTFFQLHQLASPAGLSAALLIGMFFGVCLEIGGFGSSRILSGVFYFRDLRVVKVMMSAMLTAMLGVLIFQKSGIITNSSIHILPTFYLASIIGGLIFGIGFAAGGWCPGTAIVGIVSGKIDALIFLLGNMVGVFLFASGYPWLKNIYQIGQAGEQTLFSLGNPVAVAACAVGIGIILLAGAESWNPKKRKFEATRIIQNRGLLLFELFLCVGFLTYWRMPAGKAEDRLAQIERAEDHIAVIPLADMLRSGTNRWIVIDIRPQNEFIQAHIPGALNIPISGLESGVEPYRHAEKIVLYSNGMTHPAQAQEILRMKGFHNISILTDGFADFKDKIIRPLSLRNHPVTQEDILRHQWWLNARRNAIE